MKAEFKVSIVLFLVCSLLLFFGKIGFWTFITFGILSFLWVRPLIDASGNISQWLNYKVFRGDDYQYITPKTAINQVIEELHKEGFTKSDGSKLTKLFWVKLYYKEDKSKQVLIAGLTRGKTLYDYPKNEVEIVHIDPKNPKENYSRLGRVRDWGFETFGEFVQAQRDLMIFPFSEKYWSMVTKGEFDELKGKYDDARQELKT